MVAIVVVMRFAAVDGLIPETEVPAAATDLPSGTVDAESDAFVVNVGPVPRPREGPRAVNPLLSDIRTNGPSIRSLQGLRLEVRPVRALASGTHHVRPSPTAIRLIPAVVVVVAYAEVAPP